MSKKIEKINLFRDVWSKFPTGVSIITTLDKNKSYHGMTAASVTSVSLDPLLILVVVGNERKSHNFIKLSGNFALNFLTKDQRNIANYFSHSQSNFNDRDLDFEKNTFSTLGGIPIIKKCLASMKCEVFDDIGAGDHTIFIGKVHDIIFSDNEPLVWSDRNYGQFIPSR
ncbi:MAG: flavin reductase [Chloroflexi bacterium]|nr:flavin reductase [Chloroflexota bacterium]|tara:strand:+ start:1441 stop:1947 length:507 start_codon:yes stop_codon:yes gene_type:complete